MLQFFSALQSVLAAFFGVQSESKRNSDFKKHSPYSIIIIAIVLFIVFVFSIYAIVALVVNT
ncbi:MULTISPECIES: DUF2970 domain-containing protein [Pseudoalteromonas]|uniref:DUF2970 domain-containing protein n=1 Tax=Pseudoalteromonas fuliginea TaxID=1872678 RepID=A0A833AIG9_9GAMM|nr:MULTISPECIES: DUF2970 domain-containing protein [Pseudoalteromonas]KAA1158833.1 DUF2970 domain-containing protein [Pseudoalteromonas fuliginea]KAA1162091.1 DUF2970 domain-containing protein [Pseudoalteromonas fuliginea]KAA1167949.1 DUF2970 domain-containing protein [Pseudoalteromonas fuliginea]MDQ2044570.1 DUF2970 domain-containing protein [Pseudoalteromonas sp. 20-92]